MKVYRLEETVEHLIAVVRPDVLFDLSTRDPIPSGVREFHQTAVLRSSGRRESFATVRRKPDSGLALDLLRASMGNCVDPSNEPYLERDRQLLKEHVARSSR